MPATFLISYVVYNVNNACYLYLSCLNSDCVCASFTILLHVLFKILLAMAGVDGFQIFGEEVHMNHVEEVHDVQEVLPAQQGNGSPLKGPCLVLVIE